MGSSGRPAGLDAGEGQAGVEVERGEPVGELVELAGRELHLVDLHRRGRPVGSERPVEHDGQAGQGPYRPAAGDDPGPGVGMPCQHGPDGLGPGQGDLGHRHPVGRGQELAGAQLATQPGRARGPRWPRRPPRRWCRCPPRGCRRPRSRPRTGSRPDPDSGPLAEEAQSGLLLAGQQGDGGSEHLFESAEQLGAVGRIAQGRRGQGHHHVDAGVVGSGPEPAHGAHRGGRPVGRDAPGAGHLGPEVKEGAPAQHRGRAGRGGRRPPPSGGTSCCPGRRRRHGRWASA